jgi:hypothetical protein
MFSLALHDRSITNSCIALCSSSCDNIPQDLHIRFVLQDLHARVFFCSITVLVMFYGIFVIWVPTRYVCCVVFADVRVVLSTWYICVLLHIICDVLSTGSPCWVVLCCPPDPFLLFCRYTSCVVLHNLRVALFLMIWVMCCLYDLPVLFFRIYVLCCLDDALCCLHDIRDKSV